jgi:origin recognition complex subunit 2
VPINTGLQSANTTLAPYDFELVYADRSSITGASQSAKGSRSQKEVPGTAVAGLVTEIAARHILVSVTQKAKKLFVLLGTKQLETIGDTEAPDPQQMAFDYSMLFNMARDNFVATNDTALRALMSEFKDHGLMVSVMQSTGGEAVWIPLRKDALTKIVHDLKQEQG